MAISLLSNLMINMKQPTTVRDQFSTLEDMKTFREEYLPDMYDSFCLETGLKYRFNRSNPIDEITGKWRVIGEGGGGDLSSYYTKTETNNLLNDKVDKVSGKGLSTNDFTDELKTKLDNLENYDDTALGNRVTTNENAITVLNGDTTVNGSVDKKVASCLSDSKDYTDTSIQNAIRQTAIVCDAKPILSGTTITYYQGGVEKTITSDNKTKFYYTTAGVNYSTIWIENTEFTDTVASVNFSDYVSKTNDVVNTYTGSDADKTKIPNIGAMDALKTLVDTDLNGKVNISDVESSVSSSSDNPVKSSTLYTEFAKKVDIAQGVANEGKVLQVNSSGNLALVDVSAMGGDASGVSYTNAEHSDLDNVKKALDNLFSKVYYTKIAISSFSTTPSVLEYEMGSTVSEVVFNWSLNKNPVSQSLTDCSVELTDRTATYSTPFSTNKTFTLNVSDGTESAVATKSFGFKWSVYWGSSAEPVSDYDSAFVLALSNSKLATSYKGSYAFSSIGAGQYGYVCCPTSFNLPNKCKIGGFETELINVGNFSITNASGGITTYKIVRTSVSGLGALTMVFE